VEALEREHHRQSGAEWRDEAQGYFVCEVGIQLPEAEIHVLGGLNYSLGIGDIEGIELELHLLPLANSQGVFEMPVDGSSQRGAAKVAKSREFQTRRSSSLP
jgi:hypothetical protein